MATERVTPLAWYIKRKSLTTESIKWGLFSIAVSLDVLGIGRRGLNICIQKTLRFINEDAVSVHGCVKISSIFVSESGEWKLGGFDALSSMKDDQAVLFVSDYI